MPTEVSGGYEQEEFAYWVDRLSSRPAIVALGTDLGERLYAEGVRKALCTMSGPCAAELALCDRGIEVLLTDGSRPRLSYGQERARRQGLLSDRARFYVAQAPWQRDDKQVLQKAGPFDAITCLGISLFHLKGESQRVRFLRDCLVLLQPGGVLVLDNKPWTRDLREERDPVSVYLVTGPADERPNRVLAITHSYPRRGCQIYHVQLFDSATCSCLRRWEVQGYPVHSSTLVAELQGVGFTDCRQSNLPTSPDHKFGYHIVEARKPGQRGS